MSDTRASQPLIVADSQATAARLAARLENRGWNLIDGFRPPDSPWNLAGRRVVCMGTVETADEARAALLAASRGAGVIAVSAAGDATRDQFLDDLRRLGTIEHCSTASSGLERLTGDERRLLELLADGVPLKQAAGILYVSERTADRRLASARQALGVVTTAEAVVRMAHSRRDEH